MLAILVAVPAFPVIVVWSPVFVPDNLDTALFAIIALVMASLAIDVTLPLLVTTPVRFALVVTVAAFPPMFNAVAVPVILVPTKADGVPKLGVVKTGLVNVLLVNVSVPVNVANVPVTGKVTAVFAVVVNAVLKAPEVVKLPPKVIVLPVLATPVPPLAPTRTPPKVTAPLVAEAGVKPVVLPLKVVTPVELVK